MSRVINRESRALLITIPLVDETDVDSIALSATSRIDQSRRTIWFNALQNTIRPSTMPLVMSLIHHWVRITESLYIASLFDSGFMGPRDWLLNPLKCFLIPNPLERRELGRKIRWTLLNLEMDWIVESVRNALKRLQSVYCLIIRLVLLITC